MASFTSVPSAAVVSWPSSGSPPPVSAETRAAASAESASQTGFVNAPTSPAAGGQPSAASATPVHATPTSEELGQIVSKLQDHVSATSADLQFSVDHDTGKSVVKVLEKATKTVIWQFPSEEALQVSKDIERFQKGFMVNKQA